MAHETLTPDYRAFLQQIVKTQISTLSTAIGMEDYLVPVPGQDLVTPDKDTYFYHLMRLAVVDRQNGVNSGIASRFEDELITYQNSGDSYALVRAQRMFSSYNLAIGELGDSKVFLGDAIGDAEWQIKDEDERNDMIRSMIIGYVRSAIELGHADDALGVLQKYKDTLEGTVSEGFDSDLFSLAMRSLKHPEIFAAVVDILGEEGQRDIAGVLSVFQKIYKEDVSPHESLRLVHAIQDRSLRVLVMTMVAGLGYKEGNQELGALFTDRLVESIYADSDVSLGERVEEAASGIRHIFHYRTDVGRELLTRALDDIRDIDEFDVMKHAYGDLFRALASVADSASSVNGIPVEDLNTLYEHAQNRFGNPANFLEMKNLYICSLYARDPAPAETHREWLTEHTELTLIPGEQFIYLESHLSLLHQLATLSAKNGDYDRAVQYIQDQITVEADIRKFLAFNSQFRRPRGLSSVDETRLYVATYMAQGGDRRVKEVAEKMTEASMLAQLTWGLHSLIHDSGTGD